MLFVCLVCCISTPLFCKITISPFCFLLPVIILLAVNAAILGEASQLRLQGQLTFTALEAAEVPLLIHRQQIVPIGDLPSTARTQGRLLWIHVGHRLRWGNGKIGRKVTCKQRTEMWHTYVWITSEHAHYLPFMYNLCIICATV